MLPRIVHLMQVLNSLDSVKVVMVDTWSAHNLNTAITFGMYDGRSLEKIFLCWFHKEDRRERVIDFIQRDPLTLIHIHGTNIAALDEYGDPTVIEVSFAKNPQKLSSEFLSPHPLDQILDPAKPDCVLRIFEE